MNAYPGDPGMRSPSEVTSDPDYLRVQSERGRTWPASIEVVVRHLGSDTYWMVNYLIGEYDSDFELPARWSRCVPKTRTVTFYEGLP